MSDPPPTGSLSVLCLGEALVDLICESPDEADMFVPHFGGVVANLALLPARAAPRAALAGGLGDDDWGRWWRDQLRRAGVGLDR
jgi:sugar/nucleoside kinase (ribokinase family)